MSEPYTDEEFELYRDTWQMVDRSVAVPRLIEMVERLKRENGGLSHRSGVKERSCTRYKVRQIELEEENAKLIKENAKLKAEKAKQQRKQWEKDNK